MVETASFNLGVDEGDTEELLEKIPEELTNEELLDLERERECTVEKARAKDTAGGEPLRNFSEGFGRSFCRPQQAP